MYLFESETADAEIGYDSFQEILEELKSAGLSEEILDKMKTNDPEHLTEEECSTLYNYLEPLSKMLEEDDELLVANRLEFMSVVLSGSQEGGMESA